jgi:hypothetical protein
MHGYRLMLRRPGPLVKGTILQNDGIDEIAALYASPGGAFQLARAVQ